MVRIKAPGHYWNEPGILAKAGALIAPFGQQALIIGGETSLHAVQNPLLASLQQANIAYTIAPFSGQVTVEQIDAYARIAGETQADLIIGVGGGKVLDIAKAAGDKLNLPVVAVPTIAATCASWAALSVIYDDQGRSSSYLQTERSPVLVLADTQVLAEAPKRYLASGIGDTIVKWYETVVNLSEDPAGLDIRIATQVSKLALDRLHVYALPAYEAAGSGQITAAFQEAVDAVIVLAGLAGSVQGNTARAAIAHSIHNSLTHFPQTKGTLHGEKVTFGLLTQVVLENRPEKEIWQLGRLLHRLDLPVTLRQLGIEEEPAAIARDIAKGVNIRPESAQTLSFAINENLLAKAIVKSDQWGQRLIQEAYAQR